jgi:AAA domain-containing protein
MPIRYSTVYAEAKTNGVKILVYGRAGVGKTMLCATAPTPIIISAEPGLLSLSEANQIRVFGTPRDVDVVVIDTLDDLITAYDELSGDSPFETICLDSITEIAEKVLEHALKQVNDPRQAYGEMQKQVTSCMKKFRDIAHKHIVFVAKEEARGGDEKTLYGPALPGKKLGPQSPYLFDEVFHLAMHKDGEGGNYRALQTQPDITYDAKDRSGALDIIEEPDLTKIIAKIKPKTHEQ